MAENEVIIDVRADTDNAQRSIKNLEGTAKKSGSNMAASFKSAAAALGAFLSVRAVMQFSAAATRAASVQEDAVNSLNQSLASAGTFSREASQGFQDFASAMQRSSVFGDEVILQQAAIARNFTRSNEEAQKLTQAAVELSAATGMTLDGAVKNLGKTFAGLTGELGESIPALRTLTAEQLKAGAALDFVLNRFGGSAASKLNTYSGAMAQLKNTFGDFQEQIGFFTTKSKQGVAAIRFIGERIQDLSKSLEQFRKSGGMNGLMDTALALGKVLNYAIVGPLELIYNLVKTVFNALRTALQGVLMSVVFVIQGIVDVAALVSDKFKDMKKSVDDFAESSGQVMKSFAEQTGESFMNTFDFSGTQSANSFIEGFQEAIKNAPPLTEDLQNNLNAEVNDFKNGFQIFSDQDSILGGKEESFFSLFKDELIATEETAKAFAENMKAMGKQLITTLKTTVVSGVGNAFAAMGGALVKGENAFAAFGKAVLGMFGDLAMQLGQFYLILGLGNLFLNPAAAAGQIAAGAALMILGGALKALAGGGGGATAGASASGGSASAPMGESTLSSNLEAEEQQPRTEVNVNIAGNVLDRRETGMEIADIINETFSTSGIVLARGAVV